MEDARTPSSNVVLSSSALLSGIKTLVVNTWYLV